MPSGGGDNRLVARDQEVARLVDLVEAAAAGRAGALVVMGEAGVGKTALVRAVCALMAERVDVVWATCLPLSFLRVPFLPLRSAFREWENGHPEAELPPALRVFEGAGDADVPLVFESWLQHLGRQRTVVLVVDDLQWADSSTLDVLMYVLAGLSARKLAVVATVRTGERGEVDPVAGWLAVVRRSPGVGELHLGRLDRFGTRQQLTGLLGREPHETLVDDVFNRAAGNAYWTELLVRDRSPDARSLPPDLPSELRQAVSRAWSRLSPAVREITRLVAIGGRPQDTFQVTRVAAAAAVSGAPGGLLREALDAGVLVRAPGDRYWFSHPLLAEVLVDGMLPTEREAIHAAYAQVLDDSVGRLDGLDPERATELSDAHFGAGHAGQAYRWALGAARAYEVAGAGDETIRLLRRALDLARGLPDAEPEPITILDRIRQAAERVGAMEEELAAVDDLLALVSRDAEPLRAARLMVRRAQLRQSTGRQFSGLETVREAVRLSGQEPDSAEHALSQAELARAELWQDVSGGAARAQEAVRLARSCKSPQALSYALTAQVMARVMADDGGGVSQAEEAQRRATEVGDWWAYVHASVWRSNCLDGPSAPAVLASLQASRETLTALDAPHTYSAMLSSIEASGLFHLGRWRECQARLREVFGFSPGLVPDVVARLVGAQLACWQGRQPEAEAHLQRAEELLAAAQPSEYLNLEVDVVRAELAVSAGRTETVLDLLAGDDPARPTLVERLIPLAGQALADRIEALRGSGQDPAGERDRFRLLRQRFPEVLADGNLGEVYQEQVRAMQAWYDAEFDRAEHAATAGAAWLRAAELCRSGLLRWDETYARTRAAEALLQDRTTRSAGTAALRRAFELATELEAGPLLAEIGTLATSGRVPLQKPVPVLVAVPSHLPGLTPREREILSHLVAGRTYAEIARELVISEKTVSVHVSNLLRKTGTTNRVELSQLAQRSTA